MVKQFKGAVTKKIGDPIWQKSFIEHIIRNTQDYKTRANYIYENPIRWYPLESEEQIYSVLFDTIKVL